MQTITVAMMILGAILVGSAILGLVVRKMIGEKKIENLKAGVPGKNINISNGILSVILSSLGAIAHVYNYIAVKSGRMDDSPLAYLGGLLLVPLGIGCGIVAVFRGSNDHPALGSVGSAIGLGIGAWFVYLLVNH